MRIIDKAAIPVIVLAGGFMFLTEPFQRPSLLPFAFGLFGLFELWLGANTIRHGRIQLFDRFYSRRENYSGLPARLLGIMILLFGLMVLSYAMPEWIQPGAANSYLSGHVDTSSGWGILLTVAIFFMTRFGVVRLMAGSAHPTEQRSALVDFGFRAQGLIGSVIGGPLFALGM